jgi:hypothetical protein
MNCYLHDFVVKRSPFDLYKSIYDNKDKITQNQNIYKKISSLKHKIKKDTIYIAKKDYKYFNNLKNLENFYYFSMNIILAFIIYILCSLLFLTIDLLAFLFIKIIKYLLLKPLSWLSYFKDFNHEPSLIFYFYVLKFIIKIIFIYLFIDWIASIRNLEIKFFLLYKFFKYKFILKVFLYLFFLNIFLTKNYISKSSSKIFNFLFLVLTLTVLNGESSDILLYFPKFFNLFKIILLYYFVLSHLIYLLNLFKDFTENLIIKKFISERKVQNNSNVVTSNLILETFKNIIKFKISKNPDKVKVLNDNLTEEWLKETKEGKDLRNIIKKDTRKEIIKIFNNTYFLNTLEYMQIGLIILWILGYILYSIKFMRLKTLKFHKNKTSFFLMNMWILDRRLFNEYVYNSINKITKLNKNNDINENLSVFDTFANILKMTFKNDN